MTRTALLLLAVLPACFAPVDDVAMVACVRGVARHDYGGSPSDALIVRAVAIGTLTHGDGAGDGARLMPEIRFAGTVATVDCADPSDPALDVSEVEFGLRH